MRSFLLSAILMAVLAPWAWCDATMAPVGLGVEDPTVKRDVGGCGLLLRELVRQSILISARDELGLPTRDAALRESFDSAKSLMPHTLCTDKLHITIDLPGSPAAWQGDIQVKTTDHHDPTQYLPVVVDCEKLSRQAWPDLLKKAGNSGKANPLNESAPAPDNAEALLNNFNLISQFAAVRITHEAIAKSEESPARLAVLVRGYAHLGRLTEFQWSLAAKVFKARSLLYAQRMLASHPDSADALYYRAYALAWAGSHGEAAADLASAEAARSKTNQPPPPWADELSAYCHEDVGALSNFIPKDKSLASLLSFFSVECCSKDLNLTFARAALEANPECLRVIDGVNASAELSEQHRSTLLGFSIFLHTLQTRLSEIPDLPDACKKALAVPAVAGNSPPASAIVDVIHSISTPNDASEPSLSTLQNLLEDTAFTLVNKRAEFMDWMWSVDTSEFLASTGPLVASHPLAAVVEFHGQRGSPDRINLVSGIDFSAAGPGTFDFSAYLEGGENSVGRRASIALTRHSENLTFDQEFLIERMGLDSRKKWRTDRARDLLAVNPYSALARAVMIENAWDEVKDRAQDWEQSDHPTLQLAFGVHYSQAKQYDKAEVFLRKCVEKATDRSTYALLADNALAQGDEAKWLKIMSDYLARAPGGLEPTQARVDIAKHYMAKGDYVSARPWADAAAESGAGWAFLVAAECAEGAGDYRAAEQYMVENANRYNDVYAWYFWCRRTGHGDINSARHTVEIVAPDSKSGSYAALRNQYVYDLVEGHPTSAKRILLRVGPAGNPFDNLYLALIADAQDDTATRDAALNRAADGPFSWSVGQERPEITLAANVFRRYFTRADHKLDLSGFEDLSLNDARQSQVDYFIGRFMEIHKLPQADEYLRRAASTSSLSLHTRLLAQEDIRTRGAPLPATRPFTPAK